MLTETVLVTDLTEKRRPLEGTGQTAFAKDKICQSDGTKNTALEEL
jgi:hypothetical protein